MKVNPIDYVTSKGNKFTWIKQRYVYRWCHDGTTDIIGIASTYEEFIEIAYDYERRYNE